MIIIAIITYNRPQYLDITLRSLLATDLSENQEIIVFDDASNDEKAIKYLYSNEIVDLSMNWPIDDLWHNTGLDIINSDNSSKKNSSKKNSSKKAVGLRKNKRIKVIRFENREYVVNASCKALCYLYDKLKYENAILIQDDIVFNFDWLKRLLNASNIHKDPPIGLIAGMTLNNSSESDSGECLKNLRYYTAQCFYINADKKFIEEFIHKKHESNTEFDIRFVELIRQAGLGAYVINPPICQHFGITTQVRPGQRNWPRIDRVAKGPYVLNSDLK